MALRLICFKQLIALNVEKLHSLRRINQHEDQRAVCGTKANRSEAEGKKKKENAKAQGKFRTRVSGVSSFMRFSHFICILVRIQTWLGIGV